MDECINTAVGRFIKTSNDGDFLENECAARNLLLAMRSNNGHADASTQNARTHEQTRTLRLTVYEDAVYDFTYEACNGLHAFIIYHYADKETNVLTFIALDKETLRASRIAECNADNFNDTYFDDSFNRKFANAVKYALVFKD